jgi:tRNA(fMet)-specific endonuclease VapC
MLDADVIIRGEKGTLDLAAWMTRHAEDGFEVAATAVAELWRGVERAGGEHRDKRERYIRTLLEELPKIPYTEATALQHARIGAALESSGQMIGDYDLIVAAAAVERGCAVATVDRRDFSQVTGLKVIVPA